MALSDFPWLNLNNITQRKGQAPLEGGIDIGLPRGTTITALCDGELVGAGTFWHSDGSPGYGVVSERCNIPGMGRGDVYYQHIDIASGINFCKNGQCGGQTIKRGQVIGTSKSPPGDIEVGINPPWAGVWGPLPHPGPWVDPEIYLRNLAGAPSTAFYPAGTTTILPPAVPGTTFFNDFLNKALLFLVALTLIGAGAYLTFTKQINSALKTGVKAAVV